MHLENQAIPSQGLFSFGPVNIMLECKLVLLALLSQLRERGPWRTELLSELWIWINAFGPPLTQRQSRYSKVVPCSKRLRPGFSDTVCTCRAQLGRMVCALAITAISYCSNHLLHVQRGLFSSATGIAREHSCVSLAPDCNLHSCQLDLHSPVSSLHDLYPPGLDSSIRDIRGAWHRKQSE